MKKIAIFLAGLVLAAIILVTYKYKTGKDTYWPLTYHFDPATYPAQDINAPILIVGDRLGERLANFKNILTEKVSERLSVPIKIETMATDGEGLHRTVEKIKKLPKLPLIIIYFGGSQEYLEKKFNMADSKLILQNINTFKDLRVQSLLMIAPWLSRLIFLNADEIVLGKKPNLYNSKLSDHVVLKQNEINYHFFQYEYENLVNYIKDRNAYLISITAPINLDIPPKKECDLTIDSVGQAQIDKVVELVKKQDFKGAYRLSKDLAQLAPSNAKAYYVHGKVAKQLGNTREAIHSLELAASFDCSRWRATPVHNAIIKKVSDEKDIVLYDFNQMLYDNWTKNVTFQDEIYPQNYFMEQMVSTLAIRIRTLLKL